ncbi:hypothetical protein DVH05_027203 [Phytophthora capsici]|nr:hypothetical protein DVH05_027203 [Phytophthora capsici]
MDQEWGADGYSNVYTDEYWRVDADVYRIFLELAPHSQGQSIDLSELSELCRQVGRPLRDDHEQFRLMQELDTTNSMILLRHDCVIWLLSEIHAEEQARLDAAPRPVPVAIPVWEEVVQQVSEVELVLGTKPTVFYYNTVSGESIWELPSLIRCLWSHFESQEAQSSEDIPEFLKGEKDCELLDQLRNLFLKYDDDNSGYVDISEFQDLCVRVGQTVNGREGLLALVQEVDPYSRDSQPVVSWEAIKHYWITNSPFQRRTRLGEPQYTSWEQIQVLNCRSRPILFRHTTTQQERWGHPAMEQRVADRLNHLFPSSKLDWTTKIDLFLDVQRQQGGVWDLEACWRMFTQFNHPMTRFQHVQDVIDQLQRQFKAQGDCNESQTLNEGIVRSWLLHCTKKVDMNGWEEVVDAQGQTYYYHEVNGLTQWDPPQLQTQMATMLDKLGGQSNVSVDEQIARVFRQFDADESGEMTLDEFQPFYRALLGRGSAATLTDAQVRQVFSVLDASGDGSVTLEEFQFWWKTKLQIEVKEASQVETITRDQHRREICLQFLENEDAIVVQEEKEEHFESNLLPRLVALLSEFPLRGVAYRRALNELVTDPMEQLVSLERFLVWFDRFDTAEREKLELQRAKQRAQAELRAQHEAQAAARDKQRRRRKQMRTLDAMNDQMKAIMEHEAQQQREKKVAVLFKTFDTDGSGVLDEEELLQVTKALGHEMDRAQVTRMMKAMDSSGDGRINLEEFLAFWKAFEHRRPVVNAAVLHQTRRDAVSEPASKEAPHLTTGDAVASLAVSLEMLKDRALKLTLADMRGFLSDWKEELHDKRMEHQAEYDQDKRLQELRATRVFVPSKIRVYGMKRLDVTWIEPEVVDCVAEIIMNVGLRFDPLLKPDAAQRIQALVRGHLARIHVLNVVRDRFKQHLDPSTRFFYFLDSHTGSVLLTRPLYPISTSSVAPLERADCSTKAEKYQFDKRLLELQAKKRFYDQMCLPSSEETYQYRPMLVRSALFMFDVASLVQRRLFGSIWAPLRSPQPELELVELIARRRRRQLMQRGRDAAGNLPLHYAVRHSKFPVSVIRAMVKGYPEALVESDAFGMTPIHLVFREQRTSIKLLRLLLKKREETSIWTRQTVCGDTPLHVAILHRASVGVLQWAMPSCAQEVKELVPKLLNKRGESAFHSCISQQMSEENSFSSARSRTAVLLFFKHFDPVELCSTATKDGHLPLHLAMDAFNHQKRPANGTGWLWLVDLLLWHYPAAALTAKRSNGLLPVHLSIKYGFPEVLSMKLFSLHVAASGQEKSLLKATTIAGTGPTLLHYTLVHQPQATKLLSLLLKHMPSACSSRSFATGDLPIHTAAAAHGLSLEIVRSLCEVYAEGCRTYNLKRLLPLHTAILHDVGNVEKLRILLQHCQELILSDKEENCGLRALLMAANTKMPDYQALMTLLDVAPSRKLSVSMKSKALALTPLYALSLRHCTPEITRQSVATSCHEKFERLEDEEKYFLAMAKAKLRKKQSNPTPQLPFSKILELVERNPLDEALIQRALYAMNEKLGAMNEAEEREASNHEMRKGYGLVVDTVTLNSDLMLVRAVHQTMYEFPANPRLQLLGQAILTKLLPSAYVRAAYKAKIDPYFNL